MIKEYYTTEEETEERSLLYSPRQIQNFIVGGALLGAGAGWTACSIFTGDRLAGLVALVLVLAFLLYREYLTRK